MTRSRTLVAVVAVVALGVTACAGGEPGVSSIPTSTVVGSDSTGPTEPAGAMEPADIVESPVPTSTTSIATPSSTTSALAPARVVPDECSYSIYDWSVVERRAVNYREVAHPYATTSVAEVDPFDPRCSVCEQDQVAVDPSSFGLDLAPFEVCWAYEQQAVRTLEAIVESGDFDVVEITGYRAGFTRGEVVNGLRTVLSNHSFGTAIDINAGANGLYRGCDPELARQLAAGSVLTDAESLASCALAIGGAWDPAVRPRTSITAGGPVVIAFAEHLGWRWGGAEGPTIDLMHFSITGD